VRPPTAALPARPGCPQPVRLPDAVYASRRQGVEIEPV